MAKLEELTPGASLRGILPDSQVSVVSTQWFGSEALELTYKTPSGRVANELIYGHDEPRLEIVEIGRPWSFDGDGAAEALMALQHTPLGERVLANVFVGSDSSDIAHVMQDKVTWRCEKCANDAGVAVVVPVESVACDVCGGSTIEAAQAICEHAAETSTCVSC